MKLVVRRLPLGRRNRQEDGRAFAVCVYCTFFVLPSCSYFSTIPEMYEALFFH